VASMLHTAAYFRMHLALACIPSASYPDHHPLSSAVFWVRNDV
jgi:hypothetical protein